MTKSPTAKRREEFYFSFRLEELELDGNKIVTVPLLKLLNRSTVQQLPEEKFEPGSEDQCQQRNASAAAGLTLPFPSLKRLNLAKNKVAKPLQ